MESLTKDIFYKVLRAATSWGKRRKRNGLGRGKDRECMISRNGRQMTITSAEVQGLAGLCYNLRNDIKRRHQLSRT